MTEIPHDCIVISPVGDIDSDIVDRIAAEIRRLFPFPVVIAPLLADVTFAYDENRDQYLSTKILDHLSESIPEPALKLIAVVDVDLFIPILTYIFGQAIYRGNAGVVSLFRLKNELYGLEKDMNLLSERFRKEIIHELGHNFGLTHCVNPSCVMRSSTYIEDVDQKQPHFCLKCRSILGLK